MMAQEQPTGLPCPKIQPEQQRLTPEQEAYAHQFMQARIAAQLSCAPIDETEAVELLRQAARVTGLPLLPIRWFDSPLAFAVAHWDSFGKKRLPAPNNEYRLIGVGEEGWDRLSKSMREQVRTLFMSSFPHQVNTLIEACVYGDAGFLSNSQEYSSIISVRAYYMAGLLAGGWFFHEVFQQNDLIHFARFNEMVSGYHFGAEEFWLVRKPVRLVCDEQGSLHATDGMCVQYPDGWGFSARHGVPEE